MINVTAADGTVAAGISATPPVIYLDHGVMGQIAECDAFRDRLLARLPQDGTLALSAVSIFEMANQGPGRSMDALQALLAGVGPAFFILDSNLARVAERMEGGAPSETAASYDVTTTRTFIEAMAKGPGPMTAESVVPFAVAQHQAMRPMLHELKRDITGLVQNARAAFRHLGAGLRTPPPSAPASVRCWSDLVAQACRADAPFRLNDSTDILHACVPLAVCDFVLLDKTWAPRAAEIPKPPRRADVFSGKKGQIELFLDALERWPSPPPEAK